MTYWPNDGLFNGNLKRQSTSGMAEEDRRKMDRGSLGSKGKDLLRTGFKGLSLDTWRWYVNPPSLDVKGVTEAPGRRWWKQSTDPFTAQTPTTESYQLAVRMT